VAEKKPARTNVGTIGDVVSECMSHQMRMHVRRNSCPPADGHDNNLQAHHRSAQPWFLGRWHQPRNFVGSHALPRHDMRRGRPPGSEVVDAAGQVCTIGNELKMIVVVWRRVAILFALTAAAAWISASAARAAPAGAVTEFPVPAAAGGAVSQPTGITAGPDGNLWFTDPNSRAIGLGGAGAAAPAGGLFAFGINNTGQLGGATNNGTDKPNPTQAVVTLPGESGAVTQIAGGENHSLAVTSSGQLYAFGYNAYGELGSAPNILRTYADPTPTLVTLPGQSGAVTQIAAGANDSLAVTSSGQLYAFGLNAAGELGSATNNGTSNPNPTPTRVTLPGQIGPVTQIAAGGPSLAITSSGQLYAFGRDQYGQLGSATNNGTYKPNPTPTRVTLPGQGGPVTQIAAGARHSLAVTSSGQLYAFGYNNYGQLGSATNNGTLKPNPTPTLVALPPGTTIDTVAKSPAAFHTLVVVSGLAITSGSLPAGQVGSGYSTALSAAGGTAPLSWSASSLPPRLSIGAASGVISGRPTVAGSFPVAVTVTDSHGSQTSRTFTLAIAPVPARMTAPTISGVSQSSSIWREGNGLASFTNKQHGYPIGTTFSFRLNEQAKVSFAFTQSAGGRKVKGRCVAQTNNNHHKPKCQRTVTAGTLSFTGHAGLNKVSFKGRISTSNKLRPGRYTLVILASASGKSSKRATLKFTIVAQATVPRHKPKRPTILVLHPRWHVVAPSGAERVVVSGRYVFIGKATGSGVVIDEQTGKRIAPTLPAGCYFDSGNSPALGGSWLVATCNLPPPGPRYELYSIPTQRWTPLSPNPQQLYAFNQDCAAGDPQCSASYTAVGTRWMEFQITCGYHCGPTSFAFLNIQSGQVYGRPPDWTPGGTEIPDLNSPTLTRKLCEPLTVPRGFSDQDSGPVPGTIAFYGQFAVALDWYQSSGGYVDQRYVLEHCGTDLYQVLLNSVPSGFPFAISSNAVIWPGLHFDKTLHGVFLPSRQQFKITNLPLPVDTSVQQLVLTRRTLYALEGSSRLYAAAAPIQPKK
jgi:hypothetical protein